uniref:Protein kinase domain-containing protein n=1 Tax=Oryza barthii TaxID=65489 RepID=A0A0D3FUQ6_9ORYZ
MANAKTVFWSSSSPKSLGDSFDAKVSGLSFSGCDFDVYWLNHPSKRGMASCTATCPDGERTDMVAAKENCNGNGCCLILFGDTWFDSPSTAKFKFVRRGEVNLESHHNRSLLWETINAYPWEYITWRIVDHPDCVSAPTRAFAKTWWTFGNYGYNCKCRNGYRGNPYILDGCSPDNGYSPFQQKSNCIRHCGNISVPFPFGLEEGCYARIQFYLSCQNATSSTLVLDDGYGSTYNVTNISVDNGLIEYIGPKTASEVEIYTPDDDWPQSLYVRVGTPVVSVQWVAAHLTCQDAKRNSSGYACISTNSECITSNPSDRYVGYRCKYAQGYQGNPYIRNGCVGIAIGLSVGFGILLFCLSGGFIIRRCRNDIQKQVKRKYFEKNKGLLLEQLICSNEKPSENKIFPLEELQKATNNFDPTRIIGIGGHGIVYKGILSDQRVVAIKKPKIIKEGEINQFINEYMTIPNGSLFGIIHADRSNEEFLSWGDCIRIATEAARALYYLHSAASWSVFHRDVKSSNILLDGNYTAMVSDFGASRLIPFDQSHVITNIQGTFGYLDPEYYYTGQLNEKSDVYSFGVVLVELLLRKEPIFTDESGSKKNLSNYFISEIKDRPIREIVASHVLEEATEDEINTIASLAEDCLRLRGEERPTMKEVEMKLHFLHNKVNVVQQSNNERHLLQPTRPPHHKAMTIDTGNKAILESSTCYNLE